MYAMLKIHPSLDFFKILRPVGIFKRRAGTTATGLVRRINLVAEESGIASDTALNI